MLKLANDTNIVLIKDSYAKSGHLCNDKFSYGTSNVMDKYCNLFYQIHLYARYIKVEGQALCAYHIKKLDLQIEWININYQKIRPRNKICQICKKRFGCDKYLNSHKCI